MNAGRLRRAEARHFARALLTLLRKSEFQRIGLGLPGLRKERVESRLDISETQEFLRPWPEVFAASRVTTLVATWFGVGLLPVAPGTWGSLAAIPIAHAIVLI